MVSVCVLSYNHEKYLRDCLEGIVMQRTTFSIEAWVHDDASTDSSQEIIKEYQQRYPEIIKPILQTENQYSKKKGSILAMHLYPKCTGKYVALCEGDDYWTDPYKLQKQVDFLEAHTDYSICFSRVKCLYVNTGQLVDEVIVRDMPGESSIIDLATGNYIHTPSVVFRYSPTVECKIATLGYCLPNDYVFWMLYAEKGHIWKMEEPMAVYRVGSGMWSTDDSIKSEVEMLMTLNKLWMAIEDPQVKRVLNQQIQKQKQYVLEIAAHQQRDLNTIRASRAYRIGKALLAPFKWMKK